MSKGSNRRKEDIAKIWDNWDAIFGKKETKEESITEKPSEDDAPEENAK